MSGSIKIIAEVGSVHDGSLGNALKLIETAAGCGVDAVKFQTHIAEAETLPDAPMPPYFRGEPRYAYFQRTAFSQQQWERLAAHCIEHGLEFISSPFSVEAVELLERVGVACFKIASGEVTNIPMLEAVAQTGKPVIVSSGMSSWQELDRAVDALRGDRRDLVVLQCTSEYPCPYEQVGLNVMSQITERYRLPSGLSDHTLTPHASLAAAALGAKVIEKHLTFSRMMYGSDAAHSLEPAEMAAMVEGVRAIEKMLSHPVDKADASRFGPMKRVFEKSLVSVADIAAGEELTPANLGVKKPGTGMPAARYSQVLGRKAARAIPAGRLLEEKDLA